MNRLLASVPLVFLCAPVVPAQQPSAGYLNDYIIRVRPEKRVDFDGVAKKVAEANRKAKGESYIAFEQMYGPDYTVMMVSTAQNYAGIEANAKAFMMALNEAYGPGGMKKFESDVNPTVQSASARLRRRRLDLSVNFPTDPNGYNQLIAKTRFLRITEYRIKLSQMMEFEKLCMQAKQTLEKADSKMVISVSQAEAGMPGGVFFMSQLAPDMAAFDQNHTLRSLMGEEQFEKFHKDAGEAMNSVESFMYQVNPEWSNPPKEVADVDPAFWHPKVVSIAKPKAKTAEVAKAGND